MRVEEIEQVLTDGRLLSHPRLGGVEKAGAAVAAQIGDEHTTARGGDRRRDAVEGARVVGKAVQQHDGDAVGAAVAFIRDLERGRADGEDVGHGEPA